MAKENHRLLLSLDGGGVKGLFALNLLMLLKSCLNIDLSNTFHLVVGSSVGAIIAALLSCGMLDDEDNSTIIERILIMSQKLFQGRDLLKSLLNPMYDGIEKRKALFEIFGDRTLGDTTLKVPLCIIVTRITGQAKYLCSWNETDKNIKIVDALDASSSAPIYFPPVKINGHYFIDGGCTSNNPIGATLLSSLKISPNDLNFKILSLGTRIQHVKEEATEPMDGQNFGLIKWISNNIINVLMGVNNNTEELLAKQLLGNENVLRVACNVMASLDKLNSNTIDALLCETMRVWQENSSQLTKFILSSSKFSSVNDSNATCQDFLLDAKNKIVNNSKDNVVKECANYI
jgi:patatin-like phospholipase/acyl hydrolase